MVQIGERMYMTCKCAPFILIFNLGASGAASAFDSTENLTSSSLHESKIRFHIHTH